VERDWRLILVANGKALSDEILALAGQLTPDFVLLELPERVGPGEARNLGLKEIVGEWVFFLDDDAYLPAGYWELVLPLLADPKIDVLGGPDAPAQGMSLFSTALALALSSPFCTGITYGRHKSVGKRLTEIDENWLTSCNLWVRSHHFSDIKFPEDFLRTEETRLLAQLKQQGAGLFYHPLLKVLHFRRQNFSELWRPTFLAGYFRSRMQRMDPVSGRKYFWLPAVFVLLHLLILVDQHSFWALARLYLGLVGVFSLSLAFRVQRLMLFPLITFFHYYIVFVYGLGFLSERMGVKFEVNS
jgi:glycosyltransferase involved in cell wall biosynthesis